MLVQLLFVFVCVGADYAEGSRMVDLDKKVTLIGYERSSGDLTNREYINKFDIRNHYSALEECIKRGLSPLVISEDGITRDDFSFFFDNAAYIASGKDASETIRVHVGLYHYYETTSTVEPSFGFGIYMINEWRWYNVSGSNLIDTIVIDSSLFCECDRLVYEWCDTVHESDHSYLNHITDHIADDLDPVPDTFNSQLCGAWDIQRECLLPVNCLEELPFVCLNTTALT